MMVWGGIAKLGIVLALIGNGDAAVALPVRSEVEKNLHVRGARAAKDQHQHQHQRRALLQTDPLTPAEAVVELVGSSIATSNITFQGNAACLGSFDSATAGNPWPSSDFPESGIVLSSGLAASIIGPNNQDGFTEDFSQPGDADLDTLIPGFTTFDACVLEFDFECPAGQEVAFFYVFGSEEYNEYVNSSYNDVFGFFLDGQNIAIVPGTTTTPVAINNVNNGVNSGSFFDNDISDLGSPTPYDIEADGFTSRFVARKTCSGGISTLKIAIADAGDRILDSWVLLEAESFVLNQPPNAVCQNFEIDSNVSCDPVMVDPSVFDGGSSDPDGDPLTFSVIPSGPYDGGVGGLSTSVEVTVSDGKAGGTATCQASILVNCPDPNDPPEAICQNVTKPAGAACEAIVTTSEVDAGSTDPNFDPLTITLLPPGPSFPLGETIVTLTVDDGLATDVCTSTITVTDSEDPSISCPAPITVPNDPGMCAADVTYGAAIATDNCDESPVVSCDVESGATFGVGGPTPVTCQAADAAGNDDSCTFGVTVTDSEDPSISCPAPITVPNDPGMCAADVTYGAAIATDNCDESPVVSCDVESGATFGVGGPTPVTCQAADAAGNDDSCTFGVTVTDSEDPSISCPAPITVPNDPGMCAADVTYGAAIATDNCDESPVVSCDVESGATFGVGGPTPVTCQAVDAAGNDDSCTFGVTVTDSEDPSISCPAPITVPNDPGMCAADVTYGAAIATDNCDESPVVSCDVESGVTFGVGGPTPVTCQAADAAGNDDSCTFGVTVTDSEDPSISCPAPITVPNDPGMCAADVTYGAAIATDNCDDSADIGVVCTHPSGMAFGVDTTPITCVATDRALNVASCDFEITVTDTEVPEIICPDPINVSTDPGMCGAVVNYTTSAIDNCDESPLVSCDIVNGSSFDVSTNSVTCEATDAAGNNASCSFGVTVTDDEDPTVSCPANITVSNDPGRCGAEVAYDSPMVADNCDDSPEIECTTSSDAFFRVGTTLVTCEATDDAGNKASCSFDITVEDTESPKAICAEGPNPAGYTPQANNTNQDGFFILGGEDNCGGITTIDVIDSVSMYVFGPFAPDTTFKYVQAPGGKPSEKEGPGEGEVEWMLKGKGDAQVRVTDTSGNEATASCLVPPPPSRHRLGEKV